MEHDALREQLAAYALGALEPSEAEALSVHLRTCGPCRVELAELQRVADALVPALASASPLRIHPSLKSRVLARLAAAPKRRRHLRPGLWPVAAAVALSMFVASAVYAVHLQMEQQDLASSVRAETLARMGTTMSQSDQHRVMEVVDSSTTVKRSLRPAQPGSTAYRDAYGTLWTRSGDPDLVLMVNKLPPPGAGQHYDFFVTSHGETVYCGQLKPDPDGFALLLYRANMDAASYQRVTVTLDETPVLQWSG